MSEVKVNGSACCGRSGRAAFTVPAKDCRHSAGQRRFAPALFVVPRYPYHPFESIRRG
ncbi:hypothetical protein IE996_29940 [Klebsiella pneumoniae]|uniref:Uncharacterized protein n=1 Tax=Klebsiella pneumoniae TaxID=573 RepID=A0A927DMM2_KLEPN|nr:hypothetical protein [Klebsiella pneumoniae]